MDRHDLLVSPARALFATLSLALAAAAFAPHANAQQTLGGSPHWMELIGLLPAPTYDP
jgi:hypothetical protein